MTAAVTLATLGNSPAFSAYKSASAQSINNNTLTKITFDVEDFDTNSNFASSTFTPTVAGYYQINTGIGFNGSNTGVIIASIYKNGSRFKDFYAKDEASGATGIVASLIYFNGSTDYVEVYGYQNSGSAMNVNTGTNFTYFNGSMVRGV
jgi:hypothetical protein